MKVSCRVKLLKLVCAICVSILLCSSDLYALPNAKSHAELWLHIIGTTDYRSVIKEFIELSSLVDRSLKHEEVKEVMGRIVPNLMTRLPSNYDFGFDGGLHRRLFHWGLTINSKDIVESPQCKPFRNWVELRISKIDTLTENEKRIFKKGLYQTVGQEWEKRQDEFVKKTAAIFGSVITPTPNDIHPIAVILYQVHIIADFRDREKASLGNFDYHFHNELLKNGLGKIPNSEKLVRSLKHAYSRHPPISLNELKDMSSKSPLNKYLTMTTGSLEDETSRRAMHLLLILQKQLPSVLIQSCPETMKKLGISAPKDDLKQWWRLNRD